MDRLKKSARLTLGIGVVSILAILFCHLALTDIWHGEAPVDLEWKVVQIGFAIIIAFHVSALATTYFALKILGRSD